MARPGPTNGAARSFLEQRRRRRGRGQPFPLPPIRLVPPFQPRHAQLGQARLGEGRGGDVLLWYAAGTMTETGKPFIVNVEAVPWQPRPQRGRFGGEDRELTAQVRARRLDVCQTRLAPGQVSWAYHFHHGREELFYVLEGSGHVRHGGEAQRIQAGDVVGCPPGPDGAHQVVNDGDVPLVYLAISTVDPWDICEYPDSDKVGVSVMGPDGQWASRKLFSRSAVLSYWHGEPLADA